MDKLHPVHEAQLITYLRLSGIKLGLLINFAKKAVREGILRRSNSAIATKQSRSKRLQYVAFDSMSFEVIDAALEAQHVLGSGP